MKPPNENGVYEPEIIEELARRGRAYARVEIAQCTDGLYRFAPEVMYSYGGFSGPIKDHGTGYASAEAAKSAAVDELLRQFPKGIATDPDSVRVELRELKQQVERAFREPTLF